VAANGFAAKITPRLKKMPGIVSFTKFLLKLSQKSGNVTLTIQSVTCDSDNLLLGDFLMATKWSPKNLEQTLYLSSLN